MYANGNVQTKTETKNSNISLFQENLDQEAEKVNVLLIDDDKKKLLSINSILDSPDLNLIQCLSGQEGLKELLKQKVALILLDVNMPEMDGFETAKWIRTRPSLRHTPIIFITGYSWDDTEVAEGYNHGAVDFIFSPIKPMVLKTKVMAFVELYKKNKKIEQQNAELEQLRDQLEEKVQKRTSALKSEITVREKAEKKLKTSLKEKEILLAEIHHRVKNNMAVVSALLELEMSNLQEEKLRELLVDSLSRIKSMAFIHEKLYQAGDFSHLEFNHYIEDLVNMIGSSYDSSYKNITTEIDADDVRLNLNQAIPCALLLNELLTNAYKHAFKKRKKGNIFIRLVEKNDTIKLTVKDDGVGLPEDFDMKKSRSLGIRLVSTLVKQLEAEFDVQSKNGTIFIIRFSKSIPAGIDSPFV